MQDEEKKDEPIKPFIRTTKQEHTLSFNQEFLDVATSKFA
jgi:hypothetical protein